MEWNLVFFINSALLGVGLAMDAFSVSLANGLNEPKMKKGRMTLIAGVFAGFQAFMPFAGWVCVHTVLQYFQVFEKFIPWIALLLLCYIGGNMLKDGIQNKEEESEVKSLGIKELIIQGVATSIDALSVGFTIADYTIIYSLNTMYKGEEITGETITLKLSISSPHIYTEDNEITVNDVIKNESNIMLFVLLVGFIAMIGVGIILLCKRRR